MSEEEFFRRLELNRIAGARKVLESVKPKVNRTRYLYLEGLLLEKEGKLSRALEKFDMALVMHLSDPMIWYAKARVLEQLGKMEMARRTAERAVRLSPEEGSFHLLHGKILFSLNRYDEAKSEVEKALDAGERSAEALTLQGILISIIEQDYEKALSYFDSAIEVNEEIGQAWTNRGIVLKKIGDREGAVYSFQRGLMNNPGDNTARTMLEHMGEHGVIQAAMGSSTEIMKGQTTELEVREKNAEEVPTRENTPKIEGEKTKKIMKVKTRKMTVKCPGCHTRFKVSSKKGTKFRCPECGLSGEIL